MKFFLTLSILVWFSWNENAVAQVRKSDFPKTSFNYQTTILSLQSPQEISSHLHLKDIVPGQKRRNTGIVLTILGAGLMATGIALVSNASSLSYNSNTTYTTNNSYSSSGSSTQSSGDLGGALGVLAIPASLGLTIPGIYQWVKGSRIMKNSRKK